MDPFSVQDSWHRYATKITILYLPKGATAVGFRASKKSGGITVSVILLAAMGAIVLTNTLYLPPSLARAKVKPCIPAFAAE